MARLTRTDISGVVALGSNGEAAHLSYDERYQVISTIRKSLNGLGRSDAAVIVGASSNSVAETIRLCHQASSAGGNYVLVLPPSYFKAAMTEDAIFRYYQAVSLASPLPVIIYSYPAVVAGIEMSSDLIIKISRSCRNIAGTKFTCGDTGKLARVAQAMSAMRPNHSGSGYWCAGGLADFTLQALIVGGSGVISGGANIAPKSCMAVYKLFCERQFEAAAQAQALLATGDWVHTSRGVGATKAVLQHMYGYGGLPRSPLDGIESTLLSELVNEMRELLEFEDRF